MSIEIKVPALGESVSEATVSEWLKAQGQSVQTDETLLVLETDKVSLEVYAPADGILSQIAAEAGDQVAVGALLGTITQDGDGNSKRPADRQQSPPKKPQNAQTNGHSSPVQASSSSSLEEERAKTEPAKKVPADSAPSLSPAVRKMVAEHNLNVEMITGSGKAGRLTKGDVQAFINQQGEAKPVSPETRFPEQSSPAPIPPPQIGKGHEKGHDERPVEGRQERVKMTQLRLRIAQRLKEAQNTAAILTTFNEVDMTHVMALRTTYNEIFEKKHGVKLGFMSFFVKAALGALREFPQVNAEIDGEDIVYKNFYNIGVAVGSPRGLVVPVLKAAETMSFADIETAISELAIKARDGNLSLDEMVGGTFTISNGGIYGSMMSTPILNPPQSAILGMHKTQMRPVVIEGSIEARPMMYLALSYDHRIIDGREAVLFLSRIKGCIEDPQRILLDA